MERFHEILAKRHDYARDWKARTGGKVLGYYEPYMLGIEALTSKYDPRLAGAIGATLIAGAARS